jgi:hypothetical protein
MLLYMFFQRLPSMSYPIATFDLPFSGELLVMLTAHAPAAAHPSSLALAIILITMMLKTALAKPAILELQAKDTEYTVCLCPPSPLRTLSRGEPRPACITTAFNPAIFNSYT